MLPEHVAQNAAHAHFGPQQQGWLPAVRSALMANFLCFTVAAAAMGALFDVHVFVRCGSNTAVGAVEIVRCLVQLFVARPAAAWAAAEERRAARSKLLRWNVCLGFGAGVLLAGGLWLDESLLFIIGALLMVAHNHCFAGVLPTLLVELTDTGERRKRALGQRAAATHSLGLGAGPLSQVPLIVVFGVSDWADPRLCVVLCLGLLPFVLYAVCIWRVEAPHMSENSELAAFGTRDAPSAVVSSFETEPAPAQTVVEPRLLRLTALLFVVCTVATAVGNGMTFKFWPLFFKVEHGFSPALVSLMQFLGWLSTALSTNFAPAAIRRVGHNSLCAATYWTATVLLFAVSWGGLPNAALFFVLAQLALMNTSAVTLEATVAEQRASAGRRHWCYLHELRRLSWSFSALLGGCIGDLGGYAHLLQAAACVHALSGLLLMAAFALAARVAATARGAPT